MWLHVAGLCAIAVAQPLFDRLGANPEFFVAHRAGAADVIALTLALALLLPSVLAMLIWLVGLAGSSARAVAVGVVMGGLSGLLMMQLAVRAGATSSLVAIPLSLVAGAAVALAHQRLAAVRTFFTVLGVAVVVTPAVFVLKPGMRSLVAGSTTATPTPTTPAASGSTSTATPVVLVIFDELPLLSLLDQDRQIDPLLYPNFSALARDGVWFRNATTVSDFTRWAVPSIVSGRLPATRGTAVGRRSPGHVVHAARPHASARSL